MVNKGKKRGSDPPPAHSKCSASVAGHTGVGENVIWDSQGHGSPSGSPREPASPKTPGAVIRPRRQELGSRGALRAPRREHRWAAAPGQSPGPRALAGAGGDSRSPPPAQPSPLHGHAEPRARAGGPAPHSPPAGICRVFAVPLEPWQLGHAPPTDTQAGLAHPSGGGTRWQVWGCRAGAARPPLPPGRLSS